MGVPAVAGGSPGWAVVRGVREGQYVPGMTDPARSIENLIYTYAERIDAGDYPGVAGLFTHGRIQAAGPDQPVTIATGIDEVLELYRRTTRLHPDGTPRTRHLTSNVMIQLDAQEASATARSYFTVLQQVDEGPLQPIVSGRYHDRFHVIDARWWFETRIMHVDLQGDLSRHLLQPLD